AVANTLNISAPGASTYTFSVSYADAGAANNGINTASLISNNLAVRIGGPDGFSTFANYVSINNANNGTPRTVTYSFIPPGGAWDGPDSGTYNIYMQAGQVRDLDGIPVPAGTIGSFTVK